MPKPINPSDKITGLKIQMERKKQDLTQRQLADILGISAVYMGYIEQGREKPSKSLLQKMKEVLGGF